MATSPRTRKLLATAADNVYSLMSSDLSGVYIDGYMYTAVKDRSVTLNNNVSEVKCEDGLTRSDHVFREPTDISYKIVVSKVNTLEYTKLRDLYVNRTIFPVSTMAYKCDHCMMNKFSITDDTFDAFTVNIGIIEVLYGTATTVSDTDERFQMINVRDSTKNTSYTESSAEVTSSETTDYDDALNQASNLSAQGTTIAAHNTTNAKITNFTGNPTLVGAGITVADITANDNSTDMSSSIAENASYVSEKVGASKSAS